MEGSTPPPVPKEPFKHFRIIWRAFLIYNFALASIFVMPRWVVEKFIGEAPAKVPAPVTTTTTTTTQSPQEEEPLPVLITRPVINRQFVPDDQQREIFKWMLEEKRKLKPENEQEKIRIDEEKAILKDFIDSKTIPRI